MGIMDAFNAEDRTQIKVSSLYAMLKEGAKAEYLLNAVKCEVPYQYILQMATSNLASCRTIKTLNSHRIVSRNCRAIMTSSVLMFRSTRTKTKSFSSL